MFKLLRWAFLFVVLVTVIGLAFLLGLSFGLGNNHDNFISETVPVLSMLGGWVSGIGALAAVLTTLWLADKQRREDVESLQVQVRSAIAMNGLGGWFIALNVISDGKRPVEVTNISVMSPHAKAYIPITDLAYGSSALPVSLSYGQRASFHLLAGFEREIRGFVNSHCKGRAAGLKVIISTTLKDFEAPLPEHLLTLND